MLIPTDVTVKILLVTALADSFRRAGFGFTNQGTCLLRKQLTDEQYQQIIGEKCLSVREVAPHEIPGDADKTAIETLLAGNGETSVADGSQSQMTVETFAEAFAALDKSNTSHFTQGGKPQLEILSSLLGRQVSGAERDSEWDAFKAAGAQ